MTPGELRSKGYRFRVGFGSWSVYYGNAWMSRLVGRGKLKDVFANEKPGHQVMIEELEKLDKEALKTAIGLACADLVKRRVNGERV